MAVNIYFMTLTTKDITLAKAASKPKFVTLRTFVITLVIAITKVVAISCESHKYL